VSVSDVVNVVVIVVPGGADEPGMSDELDVEPSVIVGPRVSESSPVSEPLPSTITAGPQAAAQQSHTTPHRIIRPGV
jgi:hypothetical protein